jgi:hypothetical protein
MPALFSKKKGAAWFRYFAIVAALMIAAGSTGAPAQLADRQAT